MCTAATAKRRRKQFRKGYRHLAPQGRPVYRRRSVEKSQRMLARRIETEKRMRAGKKS